VGAETIKLAIVVLLLLASLVLVPLNAQTLDHVPPVVTAPTSVTLAATGPDGATRDAVVMALDFPTSVTAVDAEDGDVPADPVKAPQRFPIGTTTIVFTATDAAGNVGKTYTEITVTSETHPRIHPFALSSSPIALFGIQAIASQTDSTAPSAQLYDPQATALFDPIMFPDLTAGQVGMATIEQAPLRLQIPWQAIQVRPTDPIGFSSILERFREAGRTVIPTLGLDAPYLRPRACAPAFNGGQKFGSWAANDTEASWDPEFGYSPTVYAFMKTFAKNYQGFIPMVVLENEVDQVGNTWCDHIGNDPEASYSFTPNNPQYASRTHYVNMLATVKKAFMDAASEYNETHPQNSVPRILVADSGMMGGSYAWLTLGGLVHSPDFDPSDGVLTPSEKDALGIYDDRVKNQDFSLSTVAERFPNILLGGSRRRAQNVITATLSVEPGLGERPLDVVNFHSHQSAKGVDAIVNFVKTGYARGLPVINNEMGISSSPQVAQESNDPTNETLLTEASATHNDQDVPETIAPEEMTKKVVRMVADGVQTVFWYGFATGNDVAMNLAGMVNLWGLREARRQFEAGATSARGLQFRGLLVAENVRAFVNLLKRFPSQPTTTTSALDPATLLETHAFTFLDKTVTAAWVQNFPNAVQQGLPVAAGCNVVDALGFDLTSAVVEGRLMVGIHPIFVECIRLN